MINDWYSEYNDQEQKYVVSFLGGGCEIDCSCQNEANFVADYFNKVGVYHQGLLDEPLNKALAEYEKTCLDLKFYKE